MSELFERRNGFLPRTLLRVASQYLSLGEHDEGRECFPLEQLDPAELHKLIEAIHGRKIAAIVYEDELPEVGTSANMNGLFSAGGHGGFWLPEADPANVREHGIRALRETEAIARHIEARDAAAKEQERAEEERVEAKADQLEAQLRFHGVLAGRVSDDLRRRLADAVRDGVEPRMPEDDESETHVVADSSDDPEHIDDCPGCVANDRRRTVYRGGRG